MTEEKRKPMAIATWLPDEKRWGFMPSVALIHEMREANENALLLFTSDQVELARQEERDACAKICEHERDGGTNDGDVDWAGCAAFCADEIRLRK